MAFAFSQLQLLSVPRSLATLLSLPQAFASSRWSAGSAADSTGDPASGWPSADGWGSGGPSGSPHADGTGAGAGGGAELKRRHAGGCGGVGRLLSAVRAGVVANSAAGTFAAAGRWRSPPPPLPYTGDGLQIRAARDASSTHAAATRRPLPAHAPPPPPSWPLESSPPRAAVRWCCCWCCSCCCRCWCCWFCRCRCSW